ncbi:hypothetical protein ASD02_27725 [Ensifer sp. Root1252]|nr:hypothetical protein ASD00_34195 [Ensifer sp. Root31]KQW59837.1 hypothetical protein ASD02_27725 [Ensifer sp. Root1252]KRC74039.1 hypothetical protein ASE32_32430 [Ensifer sp. Root231]KRC96913.1 hypothetical protein ASE47_30410 [Ensifer sp. Root258]
MVTGANDFDEASRPVEVALAILNAHTSLSTDQFGGQRRLFPTQDQFSGIERRHSWVGSHHHRQVTAICAGPLLIGSSA